VLERQGYPAVATASAAVSASLGYRDGEQLRCSTVLEVIGRIAASVEVPVTADIETGYASALTDLEETIAGVIDAGAVGINIEDGLGDGGSLRDVDAQCERIERARMAADRIGVPLVINARIDCFLSSSFPDPTDALDEAVARASAYADAGADCVYPIGPGDESTARALRKRIRGLLNLLVTPKAAPLTVLEQMGVDRVSFGPFIFRSLLRKFVDITSDLRTLGDHSGFSDMLTRTETEAYLSDEPE
jgi:2-methylisocitrate lyase-like PEP mutase family enzyme